MSGPKFGLCTISNGEAPVEAVLETAADAGYDGVEVWGRDHVGDGGEVTCRRIRERAADLGLAIPAYGSYLRLGDAAFDDELADEVAVADRLGADLLRVWAGSQSYGEHDEAHWEAVVGDLERTARRAAERDLGVTVEKHENTLTETAAGARRLIEGVDAPNCGLNWQPSFRMSPEDLVEEAAALAPLANHVHVQAVPVRGGDERCPLSEAYFDARRILDPFDAGAFDGYVNVEFVDDDVPYDRAVADDLAFLRSVTG